MLRMTTFPRLMGGLTLAYSVAVVVHPKVLAGPCGLTDPLGEVPRDVATAVRGVSARDAVVSAAMLIVPAGPALRTATTLRALCDLSDCVTFALPASGTARRRIAAVGGLWGALTLLSRRWA